MGISSIGSAWMPPAVAPSATSGAQNAATPEVKGLGVPALHTERVGDKDVIPTPPEPTEEVAPEHERAAVAEAELLEGPSVVPAQRLPPTDQPLTAHRHSRHLLHLILERRESYH